MRTLFGVLLMLSVVNVHALVPARCSATAEAAVAAMLRGSLAESKDGYRVVSVRDDVLQRKSWALVASCTDPARPMVAIEVPAVTTATKTSTDVLVRVGERVLVRREDADSRVELVGTAESAGSAGQQVRVRLRALSAETASPVIRCSVVSKGVVEVAE